MGRSLHAVVKSLSHSPGLGEQGNNLPLLHGVLALWAGHWASAVAPDFIAFLSQCATFSLWGSWGQDNWTSYHLPSVPGWTNETLGRAGGRKKSSISWPHRSGNWLLRRWLENAGHVFILERFNNTWVLCWREFPLEWGSLQAEGGVKGEDEWTKV